MECMKQTIYLVKVLKKEMNSLKERNKDLKTKIAILTIALDESEDKNKELQRETMKIEGCLQRKKK